MPQTIRIDDSLYEQLKKVAEKQQRTIREVVEEAVSLYLHGVADAEKPIKQVKAKIIQLHYPARCSKCGRQLSPGELAYWSRIEYEDGTARTTVVCLDCYYESGALARYYMKKKELEAAIRGLRKEVDRLAEEALRLRREVRLRALIEDFQHWLTKAYDALGNSEELEEAAQEMLELVKKLESALREHEEAQPDKMLELVVARRETRGS